MFIKIVETDLLIYLMKHNSSEGVDLDDLFHFTNYKKDVLEVCLHLKLANF